MEKLIGESFQKLSPIIINVFFYLEFRLKIGTGTPDCPDAV
jgi:hypothetical protein